MEAQRHFCEPFGACAHVLAHLRHLRVCFDGGRVFFQSHPILPCQGVDDAFYRLEVLLHVLFLMPRHHRLQWHWRAGVHLVKLGERVAVGVCGGMGRRLCGGRTLWFGGLGLLGRLCGRGRLCFGWFGLCGRLGLAGRETQEGDDEH